MRKLGFTEEGKEIIKAELLALGEPAGKSGIRMLEIVVPRPMQQSQREEIERSLAVALEAEHLGEVTGGGFGRGITDFFVGVVDALGRVSVDPSRPWITRSSGGRGD